MRVWFRSAVLERAWDASSTSAAALEELDRRELRVVRRLARAHRRPFLASAARALSRLGSGWLYLVLSVLVGATSGWRALWSVGISSAASVAVCFALYAVVKPRVRRIRPYLRDPSLATGAPPLDRYAFPSGHSMTASAVGIVLAGALPGVGPLVLGLWLSIGWSRIVLGHHYPSDVLAGGVLGTIVASMLSCMFL